ncbi:MAG: hypothetical protein LBG62_03365 [Candidatus Methanoplasma sp.]|nr:hypothetical protein [Candidatus Methanoplasma sp.]
MNELGVLESVSRDGTAVVSCVATPEVGDAVTDGRGKRIGAVRRVFGPVDGPYATVAIDGGAAADGLVGKNVYSNRGTRNAKDKRRNRRD